MDRTLAKSSFVLLALGLWILACGASPAEDDDPNALHGTLVHSAFQDKVEALNNPNFFTEHAFRETEVPGAPGADLAGL